LGRRPLGAILHSSNEPGELSRWLCHDDSTINIVLDIIIIIIIIIVNCHISDYTGRRHVQVNTCLIVSGTDQLVVRVNCMV